MVVDGELTIREGFQEDGIASDVALSPTSRIWGIWVMMSIVGRVQFVDYLEVALVKEFVIETTDYCLFSSADIIKQPPKPQKDTGIEKLDNSKKFDTLR